MRNHRFKSWKPVSPKREVEKIFSQWQFINEGRRSFAIFVGVNSPSSKELEIIKVLNEMGIDFFREVSFDLKRRFDFFIPKLDLVIEYDGYHHFNSIKAMQKDLSKEQFLVKARIKWIRYTKNDNIGERLGIDLMRFINKP